jgi:hypothetical protein
MGDYISVEQIIEQINNRRKEIADAKSELRDWCDELQKALENE